MSYKKMSLKMSFFRFKIHFCFSERGKDGCHLFEEVIRENARFLLEKWALKILFTLKINFVHLAKKISVPWK
ncbi:MAG: hypothetical protein NC206_04260, partial [Bacteroides sp.]|nr:hypothetical protein [Bacteroides sp.]